MLTHTFAPALVSTLTSIVKLFAEMAGAGGSLSSIVRLVGGIARGLTWMLQSVPGARQLAFALVGVAGGLKAIKVAAAITGISGLGKSVMGTARAFRLLAAGTAASTVATETSIGATIAAKVAQVAAAAAAKAWTAAQWLLNIALSAIPIVAVVAGIAALTTGFILAYRNVRWFHDAVDQTWDWIKDHWALIPAIIGGPVGLLTGLIIDNAGKIRDFAVALPGNVAAGVMAGGAAVTGAATWLVDTLVNQVKALVGRVVDLGGWILRKIRDGFVFLVHVPVDAARWLFDKLSGGVRALVGGFSQLGQWVLARVVNGFRSMLDVLAGAGTWLKDRIVGVVHATIDSYSGLGQWILARVINGFKTVLDVVGTVGGWLKDRIVDSVHLAIEGFSTLGQWILARVVNGLKEVVRDGPITTVGRWLKDQVVRYVGEAESGFKSVGGSIIGWIVSGLKGGLNDVKEFINDVIGALNWVLGKIGVDKIEPLKIDKKARGGVIGGEVEPLRGSRPAARSAAGPSSTSR